jgi:hypothetical protein
MAWGRVDDSLAFHPKVMLAGNEAMGLWVRALSYSCQQLTDGYITDQMVTVMGGQMGSQALVECGLWHEVEGGYQFNDWADYQPSRESVLAERDAAKTRMSKFRGKVVTRSEDVRANERRTNEERTENERRLFGVGSALVRAPHPIPSHPTTTSNDVVVQAPLKRGARIPDEFIVSPAMRAWAATSAPNVDVDRTTLKFVDYWRSTTKNATKVDWVATWRVWLMNESDRTQAKPTPEQRVRRIMALGNDLVDDQKGLEA